MPKNPRSDPEAAELRQRLRGLTPQQAQNLRRAMQLVSAGESLHSGQLLLELARSAPEHAEVLRWRGMRHAGLAQWSDAAHCLERAEAQRPGRFAELLQLGVVQNNAGDFFAAPASLRRAAGCARSAAEWLQLCLEFDRQGHVEDAQAAVRQVLALEPDSSLALLQQVRCSKALGDAAAAAADCRTLIARQQHLAPAWFSLMDLKTVALLDGELEQLEATAARPGHSAAEQAMLEFALGKALEDAGRHPQALAALERANRQARRREAWDAAAFSRQVTAVQAAFEAAARDPGGTAPGAGSEVIFLVGLPRSGTTLVEQVLASHSRVEGASELPYLQLVIDHESRRRSRPFPDWVPAATPEDWARLGQAYLQLSARWRTLRPVFTDKLPSNWLLAGAALRMLPSAHVIDCRRNALETCWSCYKQLFGPGQAGFSYDVDALAAYWHDYDRLSRCWSALFPRQFSTQHYEALVADPQSQIRALLAACGLPFEPACLEFQQARRAIRTPSALQVRQALKPSSPAAAYGTLLDPLRQRLARPRETPTPMSHIDT